MKILVAKCVVEGMGFTYHAGPKQGVMVKETDCQGFCTTQVPIREKRRIPGMITTGLLWTLDMKLLQYPFFHNILTDSPFCAHLFSVRGYMMKMRGCHTDQPSAVKSLMASGY